MSRQRIFEYAVIKQPLEDEDGKETEPAELVVPLTAIMAKDEKQATLLASRAIPDSEMGNLDRLDIAVRPF